MSKHGSLPVMIGKNLNKGIFAFQDKKMGGYNILIVWLDKKKDFVTGDDFEIADITGVNTVMHFCDKSSVDVMIKTLEHIRERWEGEE